MLARGLCNRLLHYCNEGLAATAEAYIGQVILYASFQHRGLQLPMVSPFQAHRRAKTYVPRKLRKKQQKWQQRHQQHPQQWHQQQQRGPQQPRQTQYPWDPALHHKGVSVKYKDSKVDFAADHVTSSSTSSSQRAYKALQKRSEHPAGVAAAGAAALPKFNSSRMAISHGKVINHNNIEHPGVPSSSEKDQPLPASLGCPDPAGEAATVSASAACLPPGQLMSLIQAAQTLEDMEDLLRQHHSSFM